MGRLASLGCMELKPREKMLGIGKGDSASGQTVAGSRQGSLNLSAILALRTCCRDTKLFRI